MKNITLCGINARYSHSSLALLCLKHAAKQNDHINIAEFSINDRIPKIVDRIVSGRPDAVGFSCYIWNIDHVLKTASTVKRILPSCFVFLGGPEVSYRDTDILNQHRFIDMVIRGQGEIPFSRFTEQFINGQSVLSTPSASIRNKDDIITTADAPAFDMSNMPFLYNDLRPYHDKIIYYETSRGCPFRCAYCMSANDSVSFLPIDRVKSDLEYFIRSDVKQVKLVDRTFNHPPQRGHAILEALIELSNQYPRSRTNFHFEISASLLEDRTLELLKKAKNCLIQLEIGIQSTNPDTLKAVNRNHDMQKLLHNTEILCGFDNIHVHVDLIAGLPNEDYDTFKKSFNDTYRLRPDTLQLGFLKVLGGSPMRKLTDKYCITYTEYAPYEVLSTHVLSYEALSALHRIESVVDMLYNTGHCKHTLKHFIAAFDSPFSFFEQFALYLHQQGYFEQSQKKKRLFELLYQFAQSIPNADQQRLKEALVFDWLCIEKPKGWPAHLEIVYTENQKLQIRRFYQDQTNIKKHLPEYQHLSSGAIAKRCMICPFNHLFPAPTAVLFDYGKKRTDPKFFQRINGLSFE